MNAQRLIMRARRLAAVDVVLSGVGIGLAVGICAAALVAVAWRLVGAPPDVWVIAAPPALLGIAAGLVRAARRWPTAESVAVLLDRDLQMKGRLGSALAIARQTSRFDDGFAELVTVDADRHSAAIEPRRVFRIVPGRSWFVTAVGIVVLVTIDALPAVEASVPPPELVAAAEPAPVEPELVNDVTDARNALEAFADEDERLAEQLAAVDELAEQLGRPEVTADERDDAAARLHDTAESIREEAERDLAATDEVAEHFDRLPESDDPLAEAIRDALARGSLEEAAERLDEAAQDAPAATEEERRALAEALRQLADQANDTAPPQPETTRSSDIGEPADDATNTPPDTPPAPASSETPEPAAPRSDDLDRVNDALRRAADRVERNEPPNEETPEPERDAEQQPGEQGQQGQREQQQPGEQGQQGQREQQQPGEQGQQGQREQQQPGEQGQQGQREQQQPGEQGQNGRRTATGDQDERAPSDVLRDAARRRDSARARREAAERMQDTARRMVDGSPQAPATGERPPTNGAPSREIEDVPLPESPTSSDDLTADWLDPSATPDPTSFGTPSPRSARAARRSAERAVEDTAIPRRYHRLIERYFRRLPSAPATTPPAPTPGGSGS
ncbi:MAG: hypothetical protein ACYTF9_08970 [Planctomycetota bacterium]